MCGLAAVRVDDPGDLGEREEADPEREDQIGDLRRETEQLSAVSTRNPVYLK